MSASRTRPDRPMKPEEWGFPAWLTPDQEKALSTLTDKLLTEGVFNQTTLMPEQHLLRFLRARDFDVNKTSKMLRDDLEWRRGFEGVTFRQPDFPQVYNFFPNGALYRAGYDLEGRPVLVAHLSKLFPREVTDMGEIPKFWVSYVHELSRQCDERGVTDYTVIADLKGFSPSKNFSLAFVKVLVDILQKFYPERLAYALVLHTPFGFKALWNMIVPFLEARTQAKVQILGNDVKALTRYVDPSVLEAQFNGTHENYPVPDDIATKMAGEGILVETGYFDLEALKEEPPSAAAAASTTEGGKSVKKGRSMRFMLKGVRRASEKKLSMSQIPVTSMEVPKSSPRVTVFGATGRTGSLVVQRALKAGYDVAAFVRLDGSGIPARFLELQKEFGKDKLQMVVGDIFDPVDLDRAVETSDAVISCVGAPPSLSEDADFFTETAEAIVEAMERNGNTRLVVVTAAQASRMSVAWFDANASLMENASRTMYWQTHYKHLAEMEKFVAGKDKVDFTFIRPVQLDDDETNVSEAYQVQPDTFFMAGANKAVLSRPALATFIMEECVIKNKYGKQGVAIAAQ